MKTMEPRPRRPRILGIGASIAVMGLVGVVIAGQWRQAQPSASSPMGRIVYQADASGKLQRVSSSLPSITPPARLWKPDVGLILANTGKLRLNDSQKETIGRQNSLWIADKDAMERSMRQSTDNFAPASGASSHPAVSAGRLSASLQEYSAISVRYDRRRQYYWVLATTALTPAQRAILAEIETPSHR